MKHVAILFANKEFEQSKLRHENELKSTGIFDTVIAYGQADLSAEFIKQHKKFIVKSRQGFGYYLWKPYIILKTLETMEEGDILLYSDAGCTIESASDQLSNFIKRFTLSDIQLTAVTHATYLDVMLNKCDLYKRFGIDIYDSSLENRIQIEAGRLIIKKTVQTVEFIQKWYNIGYEDNYHYIDDSPSIVPNHPSFYAHRHDQSIFTLLWYAHPQLCQFIEGYENMSTDVWVATRKRY